MNALIEQVRSGDYDRFLAIECAPPAQRADLYALAAFAVELARVAELVSEPLIGHMRLVWWREALDEIAAGKPPRNHPVMQALAPIYARCPAIFSYLYPIIDARAADLDATLLPDADAWRRYCAETAGNLHLAFGYAMNPQAALQHAAAIRMQGQAYAMLGLLRAIPFIAAHGLSRMPQAPFASHAPSPELLASVEIFTAEASHLLAQTQPVRDLAPLSALYALATLHAKQLRRVGYNPYRLRPSRLSSLWRVITQA